MGAEILEQLGARGTYYTAAGLENTTNTLGEQFRREDLQSLASRGHELAIHGFNHLSARRTPVDAFAQDVTRCEAEMRQWAVGNLSRNFAYPYGEATLLAKRRVGPMMASSRGTVGGVNGPNVDLNLLRANRLYGDVDRLEPAKKLIERTRREGGWLIFYTHDVAAHPSRFGCTPGLLESTARFAVEQSCKFMTVAEVVNRLNNET